MHRPVQLSILVAVLPVVAIAADSKPPSTEDGQVAHVKDAKWNPPKLPIPPGAMGSPIAVDPVSGGSIGYAKFTPGYAFPKHWHSATEYTTVISGKARFTVEGKSYDLEPGSYIVIQPKAHHEVTCAPGAECVLLTRRAGPTDYNWVK